MKVTPKSGLPLVSTPLLALLLSTVGSAQTDTNEALETVTTAEAAAVVIPDQLDPDEDLMNRYMEHVDFLASPFLEGRLPGTEGMEIAKRYMEFYFQRAGLEPAYPAVDEKPASWRQPFQLNGTFKLESSDITLDGQEPWELKEQFSNPGWGGFGTVDAPVAFAGYAIETGTEDYPYQGFPEGSDLTGKIALILRFEPMDEEGKSLFTERSWSGKAGLAPKLKAVVDRGAQAVLVVNTPGADDGRIKRLNNRKSWSSNQTDVPVMLISGEAAEAIFANAGMEGDLQAWIEKANEAGVVEDLNTTMYVAAEGDYSALTAENVLGVLPGKGALAGETVMIGGHLDHLGMGGFGSRDSKNRGKMIHPGADDNASGCAALILLAESLVKAYDDLPTDASARTIVFAPFSAEESGLNGAAAYTKDPLYPLDQMSLMINFDMIGRIENRRLSASGLSTGEGLLEFIEGLEERTPLSIAASSGVMPASDHWRFVQAEVPVLFASMENIHDDYHTPRDTSDLIQPADAVWATLWIHEVAYEAAMRTEKFAFNKPEMQGRRSANATAQPTVRFGVNIGRDVEAGVTMGAVQEGGAAYAAGVKQGDVLTVWQSEPVKDSDNWRKMLMKHKPGDEVTFTVEREGAAVELKATLKAR